MGAMQRRKGKRGELELRDLLAEHLGVEFTRNLEQSRAGGSDLLGLPGWAIEVKRAAAPSLGAWWAQACRHATGPDRPALFYRLDRKPWRVVLALRDVAAGLESAPLDMKIETGVEEFCAIARERIP